MNRTRLVGQRKAQAYQLTDIFYGFILILITAVVTVLGILGLKLITAGGISDLAEETINRQDFLLTHSTNLSGTFYQNISHPFEPEKELTYQEIILLYPEFRITGTFSQGGYTYQIYTLVKTLTEQTLGQTEVSGFSKWKLVIEYPQADTIGGRKLTLSEGKERNVHQIDHYLIPTNGTQGYLNLRYYGYTD